MADCNGAPEPPENLRLVLQNGTLEKRFDHLGKNIARVTQEKRKLGVDKILVNGPVIEMIGVTFEEAKQELIRDTDIKESDSPEEVRVKAGAAEEATDFIKTLTTFVIEKILAIIAAVWNVVAEIGKKIAAFFTDLWDWITG